MPWNSGGCSRKGRTNANLPLSIGSLIAFCLRKTAVLISERPSLFLDSWNGPDRLRTHHAKFA